MEIPSDGDLVTAFRGGDSNAFAGIYDRYADRIYSYCLTILRHPDDAAEAAQDTFLKAAIHLEQLDDPDRLRPWLFALARNVARETGRQPSRVQLAEEVGDTLIDDPELAPALQHQELRESVWDAAEGLGPRDRELLALHLSEGLDGADLAEAMGVETSQLHVMVSRMKDRVEKALGALLLARLGNEHCEELGRMLQDWDGRFTPDLRSRVTRHVSGCDVCQERRAFLLAPANVLPGIMFVPAPPPLRSRVLRGIEEPVVEATPVDARPEWAKWAVLGAVALVLGLIGTAISASFEPITAPGTTQPLAGPTTTLASSTTATSQGGSTTTSAPDATTSTEPGTPAAIEVSAATLDFGDEGTSAEFEIANTGGTPGDWVLSASSDALAVSLGSGQLGPGESTAIQVSLDRSRLTAEGELVESLTVNWDGGEIVVEAVGTHVDNPIIHNPRANPAQVMMNGGGQCTDTQTTVSARIRDTSQLASVLVRWSPDGSGNTETPMNPVGNDMFEAVIGPFTAAQTAELRIVAFDEHDNAGGANIPLEVTPCP